MWPKPPAHTTPLSLTDGCLGETTHAAPEWLGFLEATIDLGTLMDFTIRRAVETEHSQ